MQLDTRLPLMAAQRQPMQFAPESQLQTLSRIAPGINALRGVQQQEQQQAEMVRQRQAMQALQNQTRQILGRPDATIKDLADVFYAYGSTPEHFDAANKLTQAYLQEQTTRKEMAQFFPSIAGGETPRNALAQPAAMPAGDAPDMSAAPSAEPSFGGVTQGQALRAAAMGTGRVAELGKMVLGKIPGAQGTPEDIRTLQALGMPPTLENLGRLAAAKRAPQELTPLQKAQLARATFIAEGKQNTPEFGENEKLIAKLTSHPAGANVTVRLPEQEKAFEKELGEAQAKKLIADRDVANDAASIIDTVRQGRELLKGPIITGFGAEFLTSLGSGLNQIGITFAQDAVANTQAFAANMAQNVGKIIKQFGAGSGLSNDDRIYAEKMAAGKITLDKPAIEKILDINERAARNVITRHNRNVQGIKTNIPLTVEIPESPFVSPSGVSGVLPSTTRPPAANAPAAAPGRSPAPAPSRSPAAGVRREVAPGVFVTERP